MFKKSKKIFDLDGIINTSYNIGFFFQFTFCTNFNIYFHVIPEFEKVGLIGFQRIYITA